VNFSAEAGTASDRAGKRVSNFSMTTCASTRARVMASQVLPRKGSLTRTTGPASRSLEERVAHELRGQCSGCCRPCNVPVEREEKERMKPLRPTSTWKTYAVRSAEYGLGSKGSKNCGICCPTG
jgi:hypothetical protein